MAEFDIGDKVKHKVFGEGTITDIAEGNSAKLTIIFVIILFFASKRVRGIAQQLRKYEDI